MRVMIRTLAAAVVLAAANAGHGAEPQRFESGTTATPLLELFTSEGCSSCPPADRYLSRLKDSDGLWQEFVPVAWHVDYWDYIGWKDRFARAEFSDRQRIYAREGGARVVYTPGFFLAGHEWREWRRTPPGATGAANPGVLTLDVDEHTVRVQFAGSERAVAPVATVALLGVGVTTAVGAGENRGRDLTHDFVVLDVRSVPMSWTGDAYAVGLTRPTSSEPGERRAIAAWVAPADRQAPLQATGGFLASGG